MKESESKTVIVSKSAMIGALKGSLSILESYVMSPISFSEYLIPIGHIPKIGRAGVVGNAIGALIGYSFAPMSPITAPFRLAYAAIDISITALASYICYKSKSLSEALVATTLLKGAALAYLATEVSHVLPTDFFSAANLTTPLYGVMAGIPSYILTRALKRRFEKIR